MVSKTDRNMLENNSSSSSSSSNIQLNVFTVVHFLVFQCIYHTFPSYHSRSPLPYSSSLVWLILHSQKHLRLLYTCATEAWPARLVLQLYWWVPRDSALLFWSVCDAVPDGVQFRASDIQLGINFVYITRKVSERVYRTMHTQGGGGRQCTYDVTFGCVRETSVTVEKR